MNKENRNSKRLKIAVQFFGHMRTFEKCAPSLKKYFLRYYDCDVFIHTWSTLDHDTKTWHKHKKSGHSIDQSQFENKIQSLYSPKKIKIEDQVPEDLGIYEASLTNAEYLRHTIHVLFHGTGQQTQRKLRVPIKNKI